MKRYVLFGLLVAVLCSPLILVGLLLTASAVPAMDRVTLAMPRGVRTIVAKVAMQKVGYGKDAEPKSRRAIRLDPENAEAWSRLCSLAVQKPMKSDAIATCNRAVAYDNSQYDLYHLGRAQVAAGDSCTAEDTLTQANDKAGKGDADYLRAMGQAAYLCGGRLPASIAELEAARDLDAKDSTDTNEDEDERDDSREDLQLDNEWLSVAYADARKPQLAVEACTQAHPELKACTCRLQGEKPSCTGSSSNVSR